MARTFFKQFDTYNRIAEKGINAILEENPRVEVVSITPITIGYAGDETSPGVMVEFSAPTPTSMGE